MELTESQYDMCVVGYSKTHRDSSKYTVRTLYSVRRRIHSIIISSESDFGVGPFGSSEVTTHDLRESNPPILAPSKQSYSSPHTRRHWCRAEFYVRLLFLRLLLESL